MDKQRCIRGAIIAVILGVLYYAMQSFNTQNDIYALIMRSILLAIVFFVLYMLTFSLLNNASRKRQYGPPLIVCVILGLLIGKVLNYPFVGLIIGIFIALITGYFIGKMQRRP